MTFVLKVNSVTGPLKTPMDIGIRMLDIMTAWTKADWVIGLIMRKEYAINVMKVASVNLVLQQALVLLVLLIRMTKTSLKVGSISTLIRVNV